MTPQTTINPFRKSEMRDKTAAFSEFSRYQGANLLHNLFRATSHVAKIHTDIYFGMAFRVLLFYSIAPVWLGSCAFWLGFVSVDKLNVNWFVWIYDGESSDSKGMEMWIRGVRVNSNSIISRGT